MTGQLTERLGEGFQKGGQTDRKAGEKTSRQPGRLNERLEGRLPDIRAD
jgi:hypothetical protein